MKEEFTLSDLQAEVAHEYQKPFNVLGLEYGQAQITHPAQKKLTKLMSKEQGRLLLNAVSYEVDNDLIDVMKPFFLKGTTTQLINAFWNARVPHDNMWLCWDLKQFMDQCVPSTITNQSPFKQIDEDPTHPEHHTELYAGVHITRRHRNQIAQVGRQELVRNTGEALPEWFNYYTFYTCYKKPNEKPTIKHNPITVANAAYFKDDPHPDPWGAWEQHTDLGAEARGWMHYLASTMFVGNLSPLKTRNTYLEMGQITRPLHPADAKYIGNTNPDLDMIFKQLVLLPNCITSPDFVDVVNAVHEDVTFYSSQVSGILSVIVSMLSLLNFDWVTPEPQARKPYTRGVTNRLQPRNDRYRVNVTLPKTKAARLLGKALSRTRQFGTRQHEVRGHYRSLRDEHGDVKKRVWIAPHQRGNPELGVITKDYVLTKGKDEE